MNISFCRNPKGTCMIIKDIEADATDGEFALKMLRHNKIPGLLPVLYETVDAKPVLIYEIGSAQPLEKIMEMKALRKGHLEALLRGIRFCIGQLEEYLLDPQGLLLSGSCIFTDLHKMQFSFCYHPFLYRPWQEYVRELMDRIIETLDYSDEELVRCAFELHAAVQNENVTFSELENVMRERKELFASSMIRNSFADENAAVMQTPGATEDTACFSAGAIRRLIGTGINAACRIDIDKYPFTIGKRRKEVDYVLENPSVSRLHARLYGDRGGSCAIEDLNSTNGTYVNGVRLQAYTRTILTSGDVIQFSDLEFILQ